VFHWLANLLASKPGRPTRLGAVRWLRARYDAAVVNDDNRRHWANADGLSARAANSAEVRRILRNRSRYEVANNSYARGIVLTLANDAIGTGPRLQMLTDNAEANPSQSRPIRFGHDMASGVGHTSAIGIEDGKLVAAGVVSRDTGAAREIVVSARNGFRWQASIGAAVEEFE